MFTISFALCGAAKPQAPLNEFQRQVDAVFSPVFPADQPGAAVLIIKNGKMIFNRCYGIADMDTRAKITP
ncbi:MAG: hypothetical protein II683_07030, partial [Muribaculaceae bacterium]|nr:hypothetical protein [Muribaculaceae bacterium]